MEKLFEFIYSSSNYSTETSKDKPNEEYLETSLETTCNAPLNLIESQFEKIYNLNKDTN